MDIKDDVGRRAAEGGRTPDDDPADGTLAVQFICELNQASSVDDLVRLVLHRAVLETRSDRGVISWIDGNEMIVAGCHDPFGELVDPGSRWPLAGDEVSQIALARGRPEAATFITNLPPGISAALRRTYDGLKHLMVAPVTVAGDHLAIVAVSRRRSEDFTDADRAVLGAIVAVAAQPLRAARLDSMLGAALDELSERLAGAESVERMKTDVLRLASHELRTPLTVLNGYISLIRAGHFGELPDGLSQVVDILGRRTEEMNGLVNDMLTAARVDDAPADADDGPEEVDLREVVIEAAELVRPRASELHDVRVDLPDSPVRARVDSARVGLALRNVLDNAVKYSPNGGDISCALTHDERVATIRVADHGLGIAPEDRNRLFTRFGRVLTAENSHIPGIGLGLYFTREVARRHGGDVALVESGSNGTVFELTLPLSR